MHFKLVFTVYLFTCHKFSVVHQYMSVHLSSSCFMLLLLLLLLLWVALILATNFANITLLEYYSTEMVYSSTTRPEQIRDYTVSCLAKLVANIKATHNNNNNNNNNKIKDEERCIHILMYHIRFKCGFNLTIEV